MKLISMTEYVLQNYNYPKVKNYAEFLKQPLKLEMFVPVDDEGNVLDESSKEYQKAREKVLFKGYHIDVRTTGKIYFDESPKSMSIELFSFYDGFKTPKGNVLNTIEDLIVLGLELTESAIKQL